MSKIKVTGKFAFFTAKTGAGKDRYCAKITGIAKNEAGEVVKLNPEHDGYLTVQAWQNWDGALPENLAGINSETCYTVPETGLIRTIDGLFEGTVEFDSDLKAEETEGRVRKFYQVTLPDVGAFSIKRTAKKMVKFQ